MPCTDAHRAAFLEVAGRGEPCADPRFQHYAARMQNIDALYAPLGEAVALMRSS